ncbi:MAG TPA: ABC transporter permease [Acidobacteriaceae bacterium]|jgi:predicted permease|nr:ABC transporter permease [Acidobacteriaceae bacterium]
MENLIFDLKLVLRQLRKSPGFAATAVLMLAFGIGAVTAIFSLVDGILLRPLPFPDPGRLVTVGDQIRGMNWDSAADGPVSPPEITSYTQETHSFSALGGYGSEDLEFSGNGQPVRLTAARMTPGVFQALGVAPLMGRIFTQQEDEQGALVVLLSYSTWKERLGGKRDILGAKILLNRKPYTVIGVMPKTFDFPIAEGILARCMLWVPMSFTAEERRPDAAGDWNFGMVGRLKPGVSLDQAHADAERVAQQDMRELPADLSTFKFRAVVRALRGVTVRNAKPLLRVLLLAVTVVLLIACANLASLLLVRAVRYQREIAVRLALGASTQRLLRQVLLESTLLSLAGGLLGVGGAAPLVALGRDLLPSSLPLIDSVQMNWPVAGFALGLALLTGILCGLAPSFAALRTNVNAILKEGGRTGSAGGANARLRSVLVVGEIAVALVLLTAAGLLLRSYAKMSAGDLGFEPDHVTTAFYDLPRAEYSNQARVDAFNQELVQRLERLPGAEAAGMATAIPASDMAGLAGFVPEGYRVSEGAPPPTAEAIPVVGDYFRAMGIGLLQGRYFTEADDAHSERVAIVNHVLAALYWPGENPVGKQLRLGASGMETPWMTVVGEIADAKDSSPDRKAGAQFYFPVAQEEIDSGTFISPEDINGNDLYVALRSQLPGTQMEDELRATVRRMDPQLPLTHVATMLEVVSESEAPRRFNTVLVSAFALAAVVLAVLGIYGVIAFSVAARAQEMAIRMALGSERGGIVRLVLNSGLKLAATGCALGLGGAALASRLLRSFLYGVSPFDPLVMGLAAGAVFVLALLAAAMPARRAASVDPIRALRGE